MLFLSRYKTAMICANARPVHDAQTGGENALSSPVLAVDDLNGYIQKLIQPNPHDFIETRPPLAGLS